MLRPVLWRCVLVLPLGETKIAVGDEIKGDVPMCGLRTSTVTPGGCNIDRERK